MKYCNCGAKMIPDGFLPKQYACPKCGGTLIIDENGIQRWYDKDGNPGTYQPKMENITDKDIRV